MARRANALVHSASPSLDANFHSDVHGCQLGHQVAEDVGHINDLHPPSSLTHPALPAPLRLREGRELRWRALQGGGEYAATLYADVALHQGGRRGTDGSTSDRNCLVVLSAELESYELSRSGKETMVRRFDHKGLRQLQKFCN